MAVQVVVTFRDRQVPVRRALRRFFALSALGFAVNQSAYALLLQHGGLSYRVALALVLLAVAALTYVASRRWAFLRS